MTVRVAGFGDIESLEFHEIGIFDSTRGVGMALDDLALLDGLEDMSLLMTIFVVALFIRIEQAQAFVLLLVVVLGTGRAESATCSRRDQQKRRGELELHVIK